MSEISDLTKMVKEMMEERKHHDEEMAEERRLRETQLAEEKRHREEQMELLMRLVGGSTCRGENGSSEELPGDSFGSRSAHSSERGKGKVRIKRLTEEDDIEAYLTTFERQMAAHDI